ncbi:MAG: 23S rRNA (adenine(2503)-C(2))-methyltransferase RlmN [Ruminococcaceae bacterium]|nr:23S rRNA (adenine(2503)-C(2))-methyltransferase RlmN [Oscillospiraceae bacterium]
MIDIKSMLPEEILEFTVKELKAPKFRANQIMDWLSKGVTKFEDMKNLPKNIVETLNSICYISVANIEKKLVSRYDGTVKYLFSFEDKECVEAVVMKYNHGYSMCISTQVGCKMGCTFCATGMGGFTRQLKPSEMLSQIEAAQRDLGIRISNIVLMGMGEPLDNYDNVVKFIRLVSNEKFLNIGTRHITLSTCGLVPKIYDFADEGFGVTLSLSLHAPYDELRSKTMPVNRKYPVDEAIKACKYYADKTGRRITYEYAMIKGVNDTPYCARTLGELIKGTLCHVNLIPVNPVDGTGYKPSEDKGIINFQKILSEYKVNSTVRRTLGADINASCGQLRGKNKK